MTTSEAERDIAVHGRADHVPACPYVGLVPFDEDDEAYFFGRERERDLIIANLTASRLTLLYAGSGVGKSSVLRAGVLPLARRLAAESYEDLGVAGIATAYVSVWSGCPLDTIATTIVEAVADAPGSATTSEDALRLDVGSIAALVDRSGIGAIHLILDQFEEYFLYHGDDRGEDGLVAALGAILSARDLRVNVLLSIREDGLAGLDRFKGRIPHLFDNYLRLAPLDVRAGRSAIEAPLLHYNAVSIAAQQMTIEPALVELVLDQVGVGRVVGADDSGTFDPHMPGSSGAPTMDRATGVHEIETPYLQLVLTRLWQEERNTGSAVMHAETLRRLGGAQTIVHTHLDEVMAELTPAQRDVAASVFHHLVTSSGSKIALTAEDLAEWSALNVDDVRDLLDTLCAGRQRILRPVQPPAGTGGPHRYEIYHDVMGAAVLDWRRRYVAEQQERRAGQRLIEEREQADAAAAKARRHARRVTLVAAGMAVALVVVSVLGYFVFQRGHKIRQEKLLSDAAAALAVDPVESLAKATEAYAITADDDARAAILVAASAPRSTIVDGPKPRVVDMAVTADGQHIATFDAAGGVRLFAADGSLEAHTAPPALTVHVASGAISDDGKAAAFVTSAGGIVAVDFGAQHSVVLVSGDPTTPSVQLVKTPDGDRAVVLRSDKTAQIYDVSTGDLVTRLDEPVSLALGAADGRHLITAEGSVLSMWDTSTWAKISESPDLTDSIASLDQYQAKVVAVTQDAKSETHVKLWDPTAGTVPVDMAVGVARDIFASRVDQAAGLLVLAYDKTAFVVDLENKKASVDLPDQPDWVLDAATTGGRWIVTAGGDGRILVWSAFKPNRPTYELVGHHGLVLKVAYIDNARAVASLGVDGTVRRWDLPQVDRYDAFGDWVLGLDTSADGKWFVAASRDGTAQVFSTDPTTLSGSTPVATIDAGDTEQVQFLGADSHQVVTLPTYGGEPQRWQWKDGETVDSPTSFDPLPNATDYVTSIDVAPDGTLAGVDSVGHVHFWDAAGKLVDVGTLPDGAVAVAIDPTSRAGDRIALATDDDVQVWTRSGAGEAVVLPVSRAEVVVWDQRGQHIGVIDKGGVVTVWTPQGRLTRTWALHASRTGSATFSADGALFAVGTADGLIEVHKVSTGEILMLSRVHGDAVNDVAFVPGDPSRLVSTSDDTTVAMSSCAACVDDTAVIHDAQAWIKQHDKAKGEG